METTAAEAAWYLNSGWIAVLVSLAIGALAVYFGYFPHLKQQVREQLDNEANREHWIATLTNPSAHDNYRSAIGTLVDWTDRHFGSSFGSAYARCLTLAYLYPVLFFVIAWVAGANPDIMGTPLFAVEPDLLNRMWKAAVLLGGMAVLGFTIFNLDNIHDAIDRWLLQRLTRFDRDGTLINRGYIRVTAAAVAFAGAFAGAGAGAVAVAFAVAVAGAGAFAVAIAGAGAFAVAFAGAVAVAFAVAGAFAVVVAVIFAFALAVAFAGAVAGTGAFAVAVAPVILLFYVLLPLLNALADAVSIVFTRLFLSKAMQPSIGWTKIAINLLIDTVIAFACLTFLAFALPFAIEAFNAAIAVAGIPQVEWRSLLETARRAPFTEGLMVTGMLITTLLPTVVHLAVGGAALATAWQRPNPRHLDILRRWAGPVDGKPAAMPAERQAVESAFARRKTGALALAALTSFAVLFVLAHLYFSMLIALGWALPRIAFWSGDWASDLFH